MNKYRAYDKLEKQMRRVVSLHWQNDTLVAVKVEGEAEPLLIEGRFIVEQYTGLKDKNGVEIAVGDILGLYESYVESDGTTSEELEPWGEVVRTATATLVNSVRTGTFSDIIYDEEDPSEPMAEVEVIGNIHENAELLEAKDE